MPNPNYIYDDEPIGKAGYGNTADTSSITQPTPEAPTWGDIGKVGVSSVLGQVGAGARSLGYDQAADYLGKESQDWYKSITPASQAITEAPLFSATTAEHPLQKTLMGGAKAGLWNVPALIPGGGYLAMGARAAIGAGLGYSGAQEDIYDNIQNQSDSQLQENSPTYRVMRQTMPEYDAKKALAGQAWGSLSAGEKAVIVGTSAVAGEAGPVTAVGKAITGAGGGTLARLASGRMAQTGIEALQTGAVTGAQYAGTAIPTRDALAQVGVPNLPSNINIAGGTAESVAAGAIFGGAGRLVRPIGGQNESGTSQRAAEVAKVAGGGSSGVTVTQDGQPAPDEAVALKAAIGKEQPPPDPHQQQAPPRPVDPWQQPGGGYPPPAAPTPPRPVTPDPYQHPMGPIPPRPAEPAPPRPQPAQAPLPMEEPTARPTTPPGIQRQGQLDLPPPQSRPPDQGVLLQPPQPRQPVTQLGIRGIGQDVTHIPGEEIARPPETTPKPPEEPPEPTPTPPKAPVTKVSEPGPAAAAATKVSDLPPAVAAAINKATNVGDVVKQLNKVEKPPKGPSVEQAKIIADWKKSMLAGKKPPEEPPAEPPKEPPPTPPTPTKGGMVGGKYVLPSKPVRGEEPTQPPKAAAAVAVGKKEPPIVEYRKQAEQIQKSLPPVAEGMTRLWRGNRPKDVGLAKGFTTDLPGIALPFRKAYGGPLSYIDIPTKDLGKYKQGAGATDVEYTLSGDLASKAKAVDVERPTAEPSKEPTVTKLPPTSAMLGGIKPSEKAKAIVAKYPLGASGKGVLFKTNAMRAELERLGYTHQDFNRMKLGDVVDIINKGIRKPGTEAPTTGKVAEAIKGVLPKVEAAKAAAAKVAQIEEAKKNVHPNPTEAQSAANNFKQGHPPASATQGQKITVSSPAGKEGQAVGKILGTAKNVPGEHLEVVNYKSVHPHTGKIYVLNRIDTDTARFTGHLAVTNANSELEAATALRLKLLTEGHTDESLRGKSTYNGVVEFTPKEFEDWKQTRNPEEPVYPTATGKHPFDEVDSTAGKLKTLGSSTAKVALSEALRNVPDTPEHSIFRRLASQAIKYLPDLPIYHLRQADLEKIAPGSNAMYSGTGNRVYVGSEAPTDTTREVVLLHEVMHAANMQLYNNDAVFKRRADMLYSVFIGKISPIERVNLPDTIKLGGTREFLAEFVNPVVSKMLGKISMGNLLAKELGMDEWPKATQTLWGGFVKTFKDGLEKLGFSIPGKSDADKFSLLDGILKLNDDAFMARSRQARTDFGKMNKALIKNNNDNQARMAEQHSSQQNIYDTVHDIVENPDTAARMYESNGKSISDRVSDLVASMPRGVLKTKAFEAAVPFEGTDALRMDQEGHFGAKDESNPLRRSVEAGLKRDHDRSVRSSETDQTTSDMYDEMRKHTREEARGFGDLLGQVTAFRFDPRSKEGEGLNEWMSKPGWQWRNEAQIAHANADRLTKAYTLLPDDFKARLGKLIDAYHKAGIEQATLATDEMIHSITAAGPKFIKELPATPDVKTRARQEYIKFHNDWEEHWDTNQAKLRDHILNGELTENEEQWLNERGFGPDEMRDIKQLANPRGPYIPLDHAGEFIINARRKIEAPENGKLVEGTDNVYQFKNEADAAAFRDKQPPNSKMSAVYFDDKGKEALKTDSWQNPDGTVGFAKDNKAYRVEVNDKYFSGHRGISDAYKRYEALKASGLFTKVSEPQSKQSGWYQGLSVSSPLFNHLMAEIDKRTDYTDAHKAAVKNLLKDAALSSLEGNRISTHMLRRESVAGWDTDYIRTFSSYFAAHNALMSRAKYAKETNGAINDMIDYAKNNEENPGALERSLTLKEMNKRDNFFGSANDIGNEGENKLVGRTMKYLEAMSFFGNMVSLGHLVTHQTHQFLTYDVLAAKYGPLKAMAMAGRVHGTLAGTGFRNVLSSVGALKNILLHEGKGLNYVDGLIDKMAQNPKYGAELRAMLQEAINTNRLHPEQGFDASVLHMGSGRLDRGLARLDLASRQMMGATEAYSRVWGYSVGYMLARDAGVTPQQAMRIAFDSVSRTQGLLSRSNMSSIMNKWYMHAPMQFRGWGLNMMFSLAKSVHDLFKPDAPGVRAEAARRLLYLFGSTAALTGINGLPSDPMRIALALTGGLGLTNYSWADAQNDMRDWFAKETSPEIANFLMDGFLGSLGPFSFYGADRVGFGSLLVYGEPDDYTKGSIKSWILDTMGGAPFEGLWKVADGIEGIKEGNYAKAVQGFVPIKIINDWAKAWQGAYEGVPTKTGAPGMTPYSPGETFMQSLGLTPARRERWREAREAIYQQQKATRDEQSQLLDALGSATTGPDRVKAQTQIAAYNLRNPTTRITPQDISRAMKRQTAPSILGYTVTNRNRALLEQAQRAYEAY